MNVGSDRPPVSSRRKFLYAILVVVWFFAVAEATLWIAGFSYRPGDVVVHDVDKVVADKLQRADGIGWELEPGVGNVNQEGFIGPSVPIERVPDEFRIAALGDSCSQFGDPPYIELVAKLLSKKRGQPVEYLNAGVSGYSSHQGFLRWEKDLAKYRPDVVVIYFGWNDHWIAQGLTDAGKEVLIHRPATKLVWQIDRSKLVQAVLLVMDSLRASLPNVFRVPLDAYEGNLRAIVNRVRASGAQPYFVTAPTNADGSTPWGDFVHLPATLAEEYSSPREIHDRYVDATRRVADELDVPLIDAARDFEGQKELIRSDHIHPTQRGYERLAALIAEAIERGDSPAR